MQSSKMDMAKSKICSFMKDLLMKNQVKFFTSEKTTSLIIRDLDNTYFAQEIDDDLKA